MTTEITFPLFGDGFALNPPSSVKLFGFPIYFYGLIIALGFILAGLYVYKRRDMLGLSQENILDIIIMAIPCGIVGARLYYALFNLSDYVGAGNWLNIFRVRHGGLAVYGGVIGSAIAFIIYSRVKKIHIGKMLDAGAFGLLIGQAIGRWGNFFNREAYGVATDLPWKMGLSENGGAVNYVHPTFLYESLWNAVGFIILHIFSKKRKTKYPGQYILFYIAWYGFGRFMIEGLREDSLFIGNTDLRASQLLAALSFAAAVVLLLRNHFTHKAAGDTPQDGDTPDDGEIVSEDDTVIDEITDTDENIAEENTLEALPDALIPV